MRFITGIRKALWERFISGGLQGTHRLILQRRVVAHEERAPNQTAQPIRPAIPTIQATSASLTGPILPRVRPPGAGASSRYLTYEIISRLSSGVIVASLNFGIDWCRVSIGS